MKNLSRFYIVLIFLTVLSILYVRQQVETIRLGYEINAQEAALSDMLDQKQMMLYNVCSKRSPAQLHRSFVNKKYNFKILNASQIVVLKERHDDQKANLEVVKRSLPKWLWNFKITAEAEAKTIK